MTPKAIKAKENLSEFKVKVEDELEKIFKGEIEIAKEFTPYAVDYINELKNVTLAGGKRLRAAFVYYTYIMHGGNKLDEILRVCAAIELIHAFFLVEDDFMDEAETRRGYPTIHRTYEEMHEKNDYKKDSHHFGNTIAVNVGIIGDHMALNLVNNANFAPELIIKAMNRLNRQVITTGHGQIHDVLNEVRSELTEQDIINVLHWKTGIYTYDNPIHIGAILAGANDSELKDLSRYAVPGGVAFQIQDDILGSFGDESKTGKSASSDIKEGKQTLLTFKAYDEGTEEDRQVLDEVLGDMDATDEDIDSVREIFLRTGALEYSKAKALELVHEAKDALANNQQNGNWNQEGRDFLEGIADYMIDRDL